MLECIVENFTRETPGMQFSKNKNRYAHMRMAVSKVGLMPIGLVGEVYRYIIEELKYNKDLVEIDKDVIKLYVPNLGKDISVSNDLVYDLRYYQDAAAKLAVKRGRGIILHATGAGKTLTTASIVQSHIDHNPNLRILMIVPNPTLMNQTYQDFLDYDVKFTTQKWSVKDRDLDRSKQLVMTSTSFLISSFKSDKNVIKDFDMLVIDECHSLLPGNVLTEVINSCNTSNIFGFTGTLPPDDYNRWIIIGKVGDVIHYKNSKDLRDEGFTDARIFCYQLMYPFVKLKDYREELNFIFTSEKRSKLIAKICTQKLKGTTLIIYHKTLQGDNIYRALIDEGFEKHAHIIKGDVPADSREEIKDKMRNDDHCIVVANAKIFSTGLSINEIANVMFVDGGKSQISIIQSIGRGLRLMEGMEVLNIIDISDDLEYSVKHFAERTLIYNKQSIPFKVIEVDLR